MIDWKKCFRRGKAEKVAQATSEPTAADSSNTASGSHVVGPPLADRDNGTQTEPSGATDPRSSSLRGLNILANGLTVLNESPSQSDFDLDICFVHGLNGSAGGSWAHLKTGFFWPLQLTKDVPSARILLFGFDALIEPSISSNEIRLPGVARRLLQELINNRSEQQEIDRPLIFIGHSLGGLVIKKCLVEAERSPRNGREEIHRSTRSVLFFGTPNAGSNVSKAKRIQLIELIASAAFTEVPPKIQKLLQSHSDELLDLADHFREMEICRKSTLRIYSFYETRDFAGLGQRIVDEFSAKVMVPEEDSLPIQADHIGMVKFASESDGDYNLIKGILKRLLDCKPPLASLPPTKGFERTTLSTDAIELLTESETRLGGKAADAWSLRHVANESGERRYYDVPLARKINRFIGQETLLEMLDHKFKKHFEEDPSERCITTLFGMGGIGKTQLALEYSRRTYHRAENSFHDIFWLNASSKETITTSLVKLSTMLAPSKYSFGDVAERIDFVLSKFNAWTYRYLLVFDNYDDPDFRSVLDYVPTNSPCAVLFTSRLREAGEELGEMIEIPLMNKYDARDVLCSRLHPPNISDEKLQDIDNVIDLLGSLPLALDQAGAYMSSGGGQMSFKTFIQHYQIRKKIVLETTPRFWRYVTVHDSEIQKVNLSVLTTWELSLAKLGATPEEHAKKTHFLTLLAFLHTDRISGILFKSHHRFKHDCPVCGQGNEWMTIFSSRTGLFDAHKLRDAAVELANLSLIRHFSEDAYGQNFVLSLHPLIRDWAQFRLDESQQHEMVREASYTIADLLYDYQSPSGAIDIFRMAPKAPQSDDWDYAILLRETMSEIVGHMDSCVEQWKRLSITSKTASKDRGDIFPVEHIFSLTYAAVTDVDKGCEMMERAYETAVRTYGDEHAVSMDANTAICWLRVRQGRSTEVLHKLKALLKSRSSDERGKIRVILLNCCLVEVYDLHGDRDRAKELAKSLVSSFESVHLDQDFELKIMLTKRLGETLAAVYLHEDAQSVLRRSIAHYKEHQPITTEQSRWNELLRLLDMYLAELLLRSHERNGSIELLKEAEMILEGLKEHSTAASDPMLESSLQRLYGLVCAAHGQWRQAAEITEQSYRYRLEVLGPAHPAIIPQFCNLVKQLLLADDKSQSGLLQLIDEAVCQAEKLYGASHQKVIALQTQMAFKLCSASHYRLALPIYEHVHQKMTQSLSVSIFAVARAESILAHILWNVAARSEAETQRAISLFQKLIDRWDAETGDHQLVLRQQVQARCNLALAYRQLRQYQDAQSLYDEALYKQITMDGIEGPNTLHIRFGKAVCLRFSREPRAAIPILENLYEAQLSAPESSQLQKIEIAIQIAHCYGAVITDPGAYDKARDWYEWILEVRLSESEGQISLDVAKVHRWIADMHSKMDNHMKAASHLETACQRSRQVRGQELFDDLASLASEYFRAKAFDKQRVILIERLDLYREDKGGQSEETAANLAALAVNQENLKNLKASLRYRVEEITIRKALKQENADRMNVCLSSIAHLSEVTADFELCWSSLKDLLQIRISPGGSDNVETMPVVAGLASTAIQLKQWNTSIEYSGRVIDFYRTSGHPVDENLISAEMYMTQGLVGQHDFVNAESHAARGLDLRIKLDGEHALGAMRAQYRFAVAQFHQGKYEQAASNFEQCLPSIKDVDILPEYWRNIWLENVRFAENALTVRGWCQNAVSESEAVV